MDEIEAKIKDLTDRDLITFQYGFKWATAIDTIRGWTQAAKHGESPTLGPEWLSQQQYFKDNRDDFIDRLPLFLDAHMHAVIDLLVWNNQQMIDLMKGLIDFELKKENKQP